MAYTPELSYRSSCTLRRIAWALEVPMTTAIETIFEHVPTMVDRERVCRMCKDKSKCKECMFNIKGGNNGNGYD